MIADFGASTLGLTDPYAEKKEDTDTRGVGTYLKDEAARIAAVPVGWARTATNTGRAIEEEIRGGPAKVMGPVDRGVAEVQHWLEEAPSARSKALDEEKWFPKYGERSAWDEPVTKLIHDAVPMAPYFGLGKLIQGAGAVAKLGGAATFAGIGAGEAANKIRDFADRTPLDELKKLEPFEKIFREFGGDEEASRTALFQRSVDMISLATNAGANLISFGALQHALGARGVGSRPLAAFIGRVALGGAEGLVAGGAGGAAAEYSQQRMNVDVGKQQAIDIGAVTHAGAETGISMAPLMAGLQGVRGQAEVKAKTNTTTSTSAIPPGGLDPGIVQATNQNLNGPPTVAPATPPSPPGVPPSAPPGGTSAAGAPPTAPAGAGAPTAGPGAAPGSIPPGSPSGAAPAGPAASPGGPPLPAGPPGAPPAGIATGAAPVQPVQPSVTVTPPPGARVRTPPVTPQPTVVPPVPPAAAAATPSVPPVAAPPAAAATPAAPPTAAPGMRVEANGRPAVTVGIPEMRNAVLYQRVKYVDDGAPDIVPAAKVNYNPGAPTPGVTPAAAPASGGLAKVQQVRNKNAKPAAPTVTPEGVVVVPKGGNSSVENDAARAEGPTGETRLYKGGEEVQLIGRPRLFDPGKLGPMQLITTKGGITRFVPASDLTAVAAPAAAPAYVNYNIGDKVTRKQNGEELEIISSELIGKDGVPRHRVKFPGDPARPAEMVTVDEISAAPAVADSPAVRAAKARIQPNAAPAAAPKGNTGVLAFVDQTDMPPTVAAEAAGIKPKAKPGATMQGETVAQIQARMAADKAAAPAPTREQQQADYELVGNEELLGKPALWKRIAFDGKFFIHSTTSEGKTAYTAGDGSIAADKQVRLKPTAEEAKAARKADQLIELADTPAEFDEGMKALREALRPAVERVLAEKQEVPAAPAPPVEGGKAKVEKVKRERAANADSKPKGESVATRQTKAMVESAQIDSTVDKSPLKKALVSVGARDTDFEALQEAADFGRANNRADIVTLAADRADVLARKARTIANTFDRYPEGDRRRDKAIAQLEANVKDALIRAEEIRSGRGTEAPAEAPRQEEPPKDQASHEGGGAQKKSSGEQQPSEPKPKPEVTPEVKPEPDATDITTPWERQTKAEAARREQARLRAELDKDKARTLNRGDVATTKSGDTFTVTHVTERPLYPDDPHITVAYSNIKGKIFQYKAVELDERDPIVSVVRAPEPRRTKFGRLRSETELPMRITRATPVDPGNRIAPHGYRTYQFIGKNKDGHEVWQNPDHPFLRVTRYKTEREGKTLDVRNAETPTVAKADSAEYIRPENFYVVGEARISPRPQLVRAMGEEERTARAYEEHALQREKITNKTELMDVDISTAAHRRRNIAAKEQAPVAPRRSFTPLTGGEIRVPLSLRKTRPEPTGEAAPVRSPELRRAEQKFDVDVEILKQEYEHELGVPQGELIGPRQPDQYYTQKERDADPTLKNTGIYAVDERGHRVIQSTGGLATQVKPAGTRRPMSDAEFNKRRDALAERAAKLDAERAKDGLEQVFVDKVPERVEKKQASVSEFDRQIEILEKYRHLPRDEFFTNETVKDAFDRINEINAENLREFDVGEHSEFDPRIPLPDWLQQKFRTHSEEARSLIDAEHALVEPVERPARRQHEDSEVSPEKRAYYEKLQALRDKLFDINKRIAEAENAPLAFTKELQARIKEKFRRGRYLGEVEDYLLEAQKRIDAMVRTGDGNKRTADSRDAMREAREDIIHNAWLDSIGLHFRGPQEGKAEQVRKLLDRLIGKQEMHIVVDPVTKRETAVMRSATEPKPPDELVRLRAKRKRASPDVESRDTPGLLTKNEQKRFLNMTAAYEKQLANWKEARDAQFAAVPELRLFLQTILDRIPVEIEAYKGRKKYVGKSITWHLPKGARPTTKNSPYKRFQAGKNDVGYDFYNLANEMQRLLDVINVDTAALHAGKYRDKGKFDVERETSKYMKHLLTPIRNFAFDFKMALTGSMDDIRQQRKERNAEISEAMNRADYSVRDEEGNALPISERMYEEAVASSITSEAVDHGEDAIVERIEKEQQAALKKQNLEDIEKRSNTTAAERAQELHDQTHKDFPLRPSTTRYTGKVRPGMPFDADGLPTEGKRRVEFEPYIEDAVDDAYVILNTEADPHHPMIEPATTTRVVMDTVKEMVQKGEQGDQISKAITPRFLDQLARVTEGVRVYHAPYEVVSGAGTDSSAHYRATHDHIALTRDGTNAYYSQAAVHEVTHAATHELIERDAQFKSELEDLMQRARAFAIKSGIVPPQFDFYSQIDRATGKRVSRPEINGLMDVHEMLSEATSRENFRQFLVRVPSGKAETIGDKVKNVLNSLYRSIQKAFHSVMGRTDGDTALDVLFADQSNVLGRVDHLMKRTLRNMESGKTPRVTSQFFHGESGTGGVVHRMGDTPHPARATEHAAQSVAANLRSYAGRSVVETIDNVKHITENKARGLGLHTMFDFGRRTSDHEFKALVNPLTELKGMEVHRQQQILHEEDGPIIEAAGKYMRGLSPTARETVAKALIMETEHRAYLDAPLGERDAAKKLTGRNAHIDPSDIAHAQTREEHDWLQKNVFAPAARIPGFLAMRKSVHDFYVDSEVRIRSALIRTLSQYNGMLPKGLSAKDAHTMLSALEKHVLNRKDMPLTPEESAALGKIDLENEAFKGKVKDIRQVVREYSHVEGPYVPLVRHGEFAVHGEFVLPKADKGEVVLERDYRPGPGKDLTKMVDKGLRLFKSEADLRAYERKVTKELGIAQLDAGTWFYDPTTGKRLMRYTDAELAALNAKLAVGDTPVKNRLASKGDRAEMVKDGRVFDTRYWIRFSPHLLEKHATRHAARASIAEWDASHGSKGRLKISSVEQARKGQGHTSEQFVSDTMQRVMNQFKAGPEYTGLDAHERSGVMQRLNFLTQKAVMHRGVRQRYLPRRFVVGASHDFVRSLSDYSGSKSAWLARMEFQPRITEAWGKLNDYVASRQYDKGDKDAGARAAIRDYLGERLHQASEPMDSTMFSRGTDRLIRWTMLDKLPNIAYFATQGSEPIVVAAPLMMGKHGPLQVVGAMREAYGIFGPLRMVAGGVADMAKIALGGKSTRKYTEDFQKRVLRHEYALGLGDLIKFLSERGMYDQHSGMEYQQQFRRADSGVFGAVDALSDYLTRIFQGGNVAIENLGRLVTGSSAYLLERRALEKKGDPDAHAKAMQYAWETVHKANGIYNNYNTPAWFNKSPLHRLAFEFKKYPQRIIANYIEASMGAIGLLSKEVRSDPTKLAHAKQSARQLAAMLVVQGTVAGMLGLPTEVFSIPVNALYMTGLTDSNWEDYKAGFRNWAAKEFGKEGGELLSYGILRASGVDFQSRLSQADMLTFGSPKSTKSNDIKAAAFSLVAGAGGQEAFDLYTSVQKFAEAKHAYESGNFALYHTRLQEGFVLATPFRAAADLIASNIQATEAGQETPSGRRRAAPLTDSEQIIRASGFTPTRISIQQERSRTLTNLQDRDKKARERFTTEFTYGDDVAAQQKVWARVQEWNQDKPDERKITYQQLLKAKAARTKAQNQPLEYAGVALDKRGKAFLPELNAFP